MQDRYRPIAGMHGSWAAVSLSVVLAGLGRLAGAVDPPALPLQFRATLQTTAHLLLDADGNNSSSYPPPRRVIALEYDFVNKRAKATISEGYEAGRTYVRRYDRKAEYMLRASAAGGGGGGAAGAMSGGGGVCQRSHLGETMPPPELPRTMTPAGGGGAPEVVEIDGVACEHWVDEVAGLERTHVYVEVVTVATHSNIADCNPHSLPMSTTTSAPPSPSPPSPPITSQAHERGIGRIPSSPPPPPWRARLIACDGRPRARTAADDASRARSRGACRGGS